ncbi:MAG: hypothetical protein OEW67_11290 [Cyclobacteriaceae bacterium]|nr:hypothetical protein [Cyclobacteriaceae bacterium]
MKKNFIIAIISLLALTSCEIIIHTEEPIFIDERDKFLGSYRMEEYSDTYNEVSEYSIHISKSPYDTDVVYIDNFYGVNMEVLVLVRGDKLVIPLQEINGYEIEGEGWYDFNDLEFDYVVRDLTRYHIINDYCTAVAW